MKRILINLAFHAIAIPLAILMAFVLIPLTLIEWAGLKGGHK